MHARLLRAAETSKLRLELRAGVRAWMRAATSGRDALRRSAAVRRCVCELFVARRVCSRVRQMARTIATARIIMPRSMVRLSAGRMSFSPLEQARDARAAQRTPKRPCGNILVCSESRPSGAALCFGCRAICNACRRCHDVSSAAMCSVRSEATWQASALSARR
eukprot:5011824-Pleurochrysis_carterae.AAC.4